MESSPTSFDDMFSPVWSPGATDDIHSASISDTINRIPTHPSTHLRPSSAMSASSLSHSPSFDALLPSQLSPLPSFSIDPSQSLLSVTSQPSNQLSLSPSHPFSISLQTMSTSPLDMSALAAMTASFSESETFIAPAVISPSHQYTISDTSNATFSSHPFTSSTTTTSTPSSQHHQSALTQQLQQHHIHSTDPYPYKHGNTSVGTHTSIPSTSTSTTTSKPLRSSLSQTSLSSLTRSGSGTSSPLPSPHSKHVTIQENRIGGTGAIPPTISMAQHTSMTHHTVRTHAAQHAVLAFQSVTSPTSSPTGTSRPPLSIRVPTAGSIPGVSKHAAATGLANVAGVAIAAAKAACKIPTPAPSIHNHAMATAAAAAAQGLDGSVITGRTRKGKPKLDPTVKKKNRLARKAELARASRMRKKQYVNELEEQISILCAKIQALDSNFKDLSPIEDPIYRDSASESEEPEEEHHVTPQVKSEINGRKRKSMLSSASSTSLSSLDEPSAPRIKHEHGMQPSYSTPNLQLQDVPSSGTSSHEPSPQPLRIDTDTNLDTTTIIQDFTTQQIETTTKANLCLDAIEQCIDPGLQSALASSLIESYDPFKQRHGHSLHTTMQQSLIQEMGLSKQQLQNLAIHKDRMRSYHQKQAQLISAIQTTRIAVEAHVHAVSVMVAGLSSCMTSDQMARFLSWTQRNGWIHEMLSSVWGALATQACNQYVSPPAQQTPSPTPIPSPSYAMPQPTPSPVPFPNPSPSSQSQSLSLHLPDHRPIPATISPSPLSSPSDMMISSPMLGSLSSLPSSGLMTSGMGSLGTFSPNDTTAPTSPNSIQHLL